MSSVRDELALREAVRDRRRTRREVVPLYARLLGRDDVDWHGVNAEIIDRWSMGGLIWIKREAWRR